MAIKMKKTIAFKLYGNETDKDMIFFWTLWPLSQKGKWSVLSLMAINTITQMIIMSPIAILPIRNMIIFEPYGY